MKIKQCATCGETFTSYTKRATCPSCWQAHRLAYERATYQRRMVGAHAESARKIELQFRILDLRRKRGAA